MLFLLIDYCPLLCYTQIMNNIILMGWEMSLVLIPIALLFVMIMSRNSHRRKVFDSHNKMIDMLRPGMRINVGGIVGRIKKIQEDASGMRTILMQTGTDKDSSFLMVDARAVVGVLDEQTAVNDITDHEKPDGGVEQTNDAGKPDENTKKRNNAKNN